MKVRGFEICEKYEDVDISSPKRQTIASAGYDLEAAEDCVVPSIWRLNFVRIFRLIRSRHELNERDYEYAGQISQPIMAHIGVKAYMPDNEMLIIANRSPDTVKRRLCLPSSADVVDSDYYNNPNNKGELMIQLINYGVHPIHIKKGKRVAQGILMRYLRTDDDAPVSRQRIDGFGSTKR